MSDSGIDLNHPILNLNTEEKRVFSYLFNQADSDQLGVVTGERAVAFFERTKVSPNVLGEIWQIADTENRGLLTKPGFCMVLRLIGHYQAGRVPSAELAFQSGPLPKFEGMQIPSAVMNAPAVPSPTSGQFPANALQPQLSGQAPIRVPPLDAQKVQQYSGLFERSGAQNGMLDGATAKSIFERAGLPNEALGKIWTLSDREQRGALDQTEFIVAMHLLTSMRTRTMTALPNTLPPGLYEAAARRGVPPPPSSRQATGPAVIPRQFTGGSVGAPVRTQSPLTQPPGYATPPPQSAQTTGQPWLITPAEKAKYDRFFATIDTQGRGVLTGEQAVRFFSDSRLPEDTLATIWDLADIKSEGQLNRDEFAVAMYLIGQQRAPNAPALPAFLPPALVPPSMRQLPQQSQSTAPVFNNVANSSNLPKSASEDLFGLDQPSPPQPSQPQLTGIPAQTTGPTAPRDPFGGGPPLSPSSPQRAQTLPQQPNTMFKPFMPTSQFGAALAQQNTGGSLTSSQGQPRGFPPPQQQSHSTGHQPPSHMDDLLGDNDTHAEESNKLNNETTELANMSNQIGNLRSQMEQSQTKRSATQQDLNTTSTQKRDLELRLQQFRAQYEQEVRTVKELEQELTKTRESTKKLGQDLAMLEGTYQDLQTQHNTVAQALQTDQQENAALKQRIAEMNIEVTRLKPEVEKMKLDARQQKGMVSINKKQLTTNEAERDRLQAEKASLEREAAERERLQAERANREREEAAERERVQAAKALQEREAAERERLQAAKVAQEREAAEREAQARSAAAQQSVQHYGQNAAVGAGVGAAGVGAAAFGAYEAIKRHSGAGDVTSPGPGSNVVSPSAASTMSRTNPFFRGAGVDGAAERAVSPPAGGPTPSAFDALFGPSAAFAPSGQASSRTGTPPATSFIGRPTPVPSSNAAPPGMADSVQSFSTVGEATPSATPPLSDRAKESPQTAEPPPPPENRQFTPSQLPVVSFTGGSRDDSPASSTRVIPPASRAGGVETPNEVETHDVASRDGNLPPNSSLDLARTRTEETVPGAFPTEEPQPVTIAQEVAPETPLEPATSGRDDFDSAFASFGEGEKAQEISHNADDPFAAPSGREPPHTEGVFDSEFPPIRNLEPEDEDDSDDEPATGSADDFAAAAPSIHTGGGSKGIATETPTASAIEPPSASDLPPITSQTSPPSYEQSNDVSHGGSGERSTSNHFPPEFGGLLPAREDPTSPPPPNSSTAVEEKENLQPTPAPAQASTTNSFLPGTTTPSTNDVFHDANSRPASSFFGGFGTASSTAPSAAPAAQAAQAVPPKNAFDDFDDFDDLAEAKEADPSGSDLDFGFPRHNVEDFNAAFDSPTTSVTNTLASASTQQTPVPSNRSLQQSSSESNGFPTFPPPSSSTYASAFPLASSGSSIQNTPQNAQHDWDAIFSGLDSNKNIDTSLSNNAPNDDPWAAPAGPSATTAAERTPTAASPVSASTVTASAKGAGLGRALTPGTEHDDPILKRLTNMGYPRSDALGALEKYDYDINKAVDHLTSR